MPREYKPKCYGCNKKAKKGHLFCSMKCAAMYAEELIIGNEQSYCFTCSEWVCDEFSHNQNCVPNTITMDQWVNRA